MHKNSPDHTSCVDYSPAEDVRPIGYDRVDYFSAAVGQTCRYCWRVRNRFSTFWLRDFSSWAWTLGHSSIFRPLRWTLWHQETKLYADWSHTKLEEFCSGKILWLLLHRLICKIHFSKSWRSIVYGTFPGRVLLPYGWYLAPCFFVHKREWRYQRFYRKGFKFKFKLFIFTNSFSFYLIHLLY